MLNIAIYRRNKLQQRFGKIGCNPFMCQRRANAVRVTGRCQCHLR
jgi:hypothetical protein